MQWNEDGRYLEERNSKWDPCNDSEVAFHDNGHQCEAALETNKIKNFFCLLQNLQVCDLRSSESWLRPRQLTHRCVHLCSSLVEVFENLWWTLGGVFAAAGGDAFLFKVSRLVPVREVIHPAAMQLSRKQSQETAGFLGLFVFCLNKWRTDTTADHRAELMETESAATREESSISAAAPLFIVLKWPCANKRCTVC